jgi:hypothetical protein
MLVFCLGVGHPLIFSLFKKKIRWQVIAHKTRGLEGWLEKPIFHLFSYENTITH